MFFMLSKVFWTLCNPLTLVTIFICGGALLRDYRAGRRVLGVGIALLAVFGFSPLGHNVLAYQENQYPVATNLPQKVDGIIVLGGAIELQRSVERGQGQLNEHAPRITEMIALARKYPKAKLVFAGGNGSLEDSSSSESKEIDSLLKNINFDTVRIIYEDKSRNTYENMAFSKDIVSPKEGEVWLLVTSAFHMNRSVAIFNSNGWRVTPYPAGYLTDGNFRMTPNFDVLGNMYKLQIAVREMLGIMAYTLTGKIKLNEIDSDLPISSDASHSATVSSGQSK